MFVDSLASTYSDAAFNDINKYFHSLASSETIFFATFNVAHISEYLKKLKMHFSLAPNEVSSFILSRCAKSFTTTLTLLFNASDC